jgi:hypothetical protein
MGGLKNDANAALKRIKKHQGKMGLSIFPRLYDY